jgi:hypothetical protein
MMRHCTSVFLSRMPFFITRPYPLPSSAQLVMHILGSLTAGIQIQICCRLQHYSVRLRLNISQVIITTYHFRYSLRFGRGPCSNPDLTCSVRPFFSTPVFLVRDDAQRHRLATKQRAKARFQKFGNRDSQHARKYAQEVSVCLRRSQIIHIAGCI